ncbi:MAG: hypothetical protein A2V67_12550 [Deltaproteobacteria bacterium RBG_13_61_14]|nr:MAG: hypothetical protein A2V67_12550 [Deltaproteobacteria bacterium RBG_13_61_14]
MSTKSTSPVKEDPAALLTVQQVARRLAVSKSLVYEWTDEGRLAYVDLGQDGRRRCLRFKPEDLEKFIQDHARN